MGNETPLEDLLKPKVDSVEDSADDTFPPPKAEVVPDPAPKVEDPKPAAASDAVPDGEQAPGDGERKRPVNLPKWAHERMRANDEKTTAAERRAAEVERQAEADRQRVRELEEYIQNNGHTPPEQEQQQFDPKAYTDAAIFDTRNELGWERAVEKYGQDLPHQATNWAGDRCKADDHFRQQVFKAVDPVAFSIREFKKAQTVTELEKFGGDLDAMVKARVEEALKAKPAATPTADAAPAPARQQTQPNDFAGAASSPAAANTDPQRAGPRPLGELLNLKRR